MRLTCSLSTRQCPPPSPDTKERLATLGFVPVANTPAEFGRMIGPEVARWKQVIRQANTKADP
jgi:tripartite-type tricarboxylate transporter receptor subunit TctC